MFTISFKCGRHHLHAHVTMSRVTAVGAKYTSDGLARLYPHDCSNLLLFYLLLQSAGFFNMLLFALVMLPRTSALQEVESEAICVSFQTIYLGSIFTVGSIFSTLLCNLHTGSDHQGWAAVPSAPYLQDRRTNFR